MLDISEVNQIEARRKANLKEIYTRIYEQFERKIRGVIETGREKQVFLRVPIMVIGYPRFDRERASIWLARQLKNGGFQVQRVSEIDIYVTWVKKKKKPKKRKPQKVEESDPSDFPDLMNLKKLANHYRKK
tara:strand:- start:305 stop:697 length:393 start_codon:yes stop_codon:yes gene_type:complete